MVGKNVKQLSTTNHNLDSLKVFHREKKVIGYTRESMFEIVNDVASYREFLPFCLNSEIIQKDIPSTVIRPRVVKEKDDAKVIPRTFKAQLTIGFPPFKESYVSTISYVRPDFIKTLSQNTSVFEYIAAEWKFLPYDSSRNTIVLNEHIDDKNRCCVIDFNVSFKFNSIFYSRFASIFLENIFKQMVSAFEKRAKEKYGDSGKYLLKK
jgi:coenzyme Q-binding protein COQ10